MTQTNAQQPTKPAQQTPLKRSEQKLLNKPAQSQQSGKSGQPQQSTKSV
jgi:hypothetical protein